LSAVRWLSQQEDETLGQVSGVFTWQSHPQRQQELKDWVNHLHAPSWLRHLATTDTVSVLGESLPAGILVTQAGWMSPPKVVAKLLDHPNIRLCCATRVTTLKEQATDGWTIHLQDSHGVSEEDYDAIVVACGTGVDQLLPEWTEHLPKQKGQVVHLPMQTWQGQVPTMPWMFDGYAMPPVAGQICIGATFEKATPLGVTSAGIADNLQCLADAISQHRYLPTSRLTGHSAYRLMTKDHLPLVGGLVKVDSYQTGIAQCVHRPDTCKEMSYSLRSNLYVSIGHGSRGLTSAFLAAEVIRSQILGQISPVGLRLLQAVHPARTFFRQMHTVKE
jgi:tRNA 5-methylaminomethyl-2-thiouridine biosynthesis bifunctional protein